MHGESAGGAAGTHECMLKRERVGGVRGWDWRGGGRRLTGSRNGEPYRRSVPLAISAVIVAHLTSVLPYTLSFSPSPEWLSTTVSLLARSGLSPPLLFLFFLGSVLLATAGLPRFDI